ncbi:MAG: nuclear transport factor 2 family protein [Actinobacteria bacterium]|nr:nuclear transport factor 2 family protein [Actinomycetota bacterium]
MTDALQQLLDRHAIEDVLNEYCRALDEMDLDVLLDLFTEDCLVEYGPEDRLRHRGSADLRQALERLWRYKRSSHHLSNILIHFDGADAAVVRSGIIAWHEKADGDEAILYAIYLDRFVRTASGWRIAERRQQRAGESKGFVVNITPLPRREPPEGWTPVGWEK